MASIALQSYIDHTKRYEPLSEHTYAGYERGMRVTGVREVDPANIQDVWKSILAKLEAGVDYGGINFAVWLIIATLKLHGHTVAKDYYLNTILAILRKKGSVPKGLSTEEVLKVLKLARPQVMSGDKELFKLLTLLTYSGIRVSSAEGLKLEDFKHVPEYKCWGFLCHAKGKYSWAFVSENGYRTLDFYTLRKDRPLIEYDATNRKTPFEVLYRSKMSYFIASHQVEILNVFKDKQPFHSFRKHFAKCLAEAALYSDDISMLMQQSPPTIAFRKYITNGVEMPPELLNRLAKAYSQTKLIALEV